MGYIRNLLFFTLFAFIVSGCGGGNTTITNNNASNGTTTSDTGRILISNNSTSSSVTGSVTLHWSAPTSWADGTSVSLSSISGFRIFYGPSPSNTPNTIDINDGTVTNYTVTLPSGSYYFIICAVDSSGNQGLRSIALLKSI